MKQNQNNKMMVSIYKDFKQNLGVKNLLEIFKDIKSDKYKNDIESIRYALHKNADAKASHIKNKLTSFTTSGTFGKSRTKNNIISYSQILCLDFDNIPITEINNLSRVVNQCRYTLVHGCFFQTG